MSGGPDVLGGVPDAVDALVCSAKGCRADATWALLWNNPRLHTPARRKVWLACDEHREHLASFLDLRGFLRDTVPAADVAAPAGPTAPAAPAADTSAADTPGDPTSEEGERRG